MTYIPSFTTCRHSGGLQHVGVIHFRFSLAKCQHTQHWSSVRLFSVQLCAVPIKFGCENWNSFDETNLDGLGWSSKNWPAKTFKNPNGNRLSDYRKRMRQAVLMPFHQQGGSACGNAVRGWGHPWSSMVIQTKTHPEEYGCPLVPSGNLLPFAIENGHRNSGFTH